MQAIRNAINSLVGVAGGPLTRAVTFADLVSVGLLTQAQVTSKQSAMSAAAAAIAAGDAATVELINAETLRAVSAEASIAASIPALAAAERARAEAAEAVLTAAIVTEVARAEAEEAALAPVVINNGTVATTVTSLGPPGSSTTIRKWMEITHSGTTYYAPLY